MSVSVAKHGIHNTGTIKNKIKKHPIIYWTVFFFSTAIQFDVSALKRIFLFESLETNAKLFSFLGNEKTFFFF